MNETMMNEILKRLDLIGAKLGEGGAFTWETFVKQAVVIDGWMMLGVAVLPLTGVVVALMLLKWLWRRIANPSYKPDAHWPEDRQREKYAVEDGFERGFASGVILLVTAGLVAITTTIATNALAHILNPDYYALMDLARMIGN